jgi:DNA-binding transcriptional LysR family regulator
LALEQRPVIGPGDGLEVVPERGARGGCDNTLEDDHERHELQRNGEAGAATRRIAALEEALRTRLLARSTRRVSLTAEGEVYREHALAILDAVRHSHEALRDFDATPRGRLRVTSRSSIGLRLIVPFVCEFTTRYPEVSLGLALSDAPVDIVAEGFAVAIAMGHLSSSRLIAKTLAVTDSLICASPDDLARRGTPADPGELKAHECLSFQARTGRNTWKFSQGEQCTDVRIEAKIAINNGEALKQLALDGLGIVLVTDWLVREELEAGALVPLFADYALEPVATPITALCPTRTQLPRKVRAFLDFVAEKAELILGARTTTRTHVNHRPSSD